MSPAKAPTTAERARSILARADGAAVLWLDGVPGEDTRVDSVVLTDGRRRWATQRPVAVEIADVAPLPFRDRIRARVHVHGHAELLDSGALALAPCQIELHEPGASHLISPEALRAATPDLLATREGALLGHLATDHAGMLKALVRLIDPNLLEGAQRAVPLGLDRHGLVMRVEHRRGHADVRLGFDAPAETFDEVRTALGELTKRALLSDLLRAGPAAARICQPER